MPEGLNPIASSIPKRVFITVAETSGDQHAAELIRALRATDPTIQAEGHGGPAMRDAGAVIHRETVGKAAMLHHALKRVPEIWKLLRWTRDYYRQHPPDLHICIDSSGMNLHFAKVARECGVPVLYYIAPQLWASRPKRISQVRKYVNRVACILPFEEAYYRDRGVRADFVGHPLFDEMPVDRSRAPGPVFPDRPPVIGLMPGSRRSEVRGHLPRMMRVARQIAERYLGARFLIPSTPSTHALVSELLAAALAAEFSPLADQFELLEGGINRMLPRCDVCIAKSGTTTLQVAAFGVPMIIVYHVPPLTWHVLGRWLRKWVVTTRHVGMPNILADHSGRSPADGPLVPEIFPWSGPTEPVGQMVLDLLANPRQLAEERQALLDVVAPLNRRGASAHAAGIALEMLAVPITAMATHPNLPRGPAFPPPRSGG